MLVAPWLTLVVLCGADADERPTELVRAAAPTSGRVPSPRRLFNSGLAAEEQGQGPQAVARYLQARMVPRTSFADALYARGAGLRLLRLLAGRDDDAATAIAALLARDGEPEPGSELSPLMRSLLARVGERLEVWTGVVTAVTLDRAGGAWLTLRRPDGDARKVWSPAPVSPFSAGDPARVVARRRGDDYVLVALGRPETRTWGLLAVRGLERATLPTAALNGRTPRRGRGRGRSAGRGR